MKTVSTIVLVILILLAGLSGFTKVALVVRHDLSSVLRLAGL